MARKNDFIKGSAAAIAMALLILDTKNALAGAQSGIELCIKTVIPSLFPFFVLSIMLTGTLMGKHIRPLGGICRLCRIPEGAESLLLAGLLGGYPVGAQCISQAYTAGQLSKQDARRMLAFCSNCGPAFLFGMAASLFDQYWIPWALWGIHIASALLTALLIPGQPSRSVSVKSGSSMSPLQALNQSVRVMAGVCGWVVIFRIVITLLEHWILWIFPVEVQVTISGLLELSNGCVELHRIENTGLRLILCAGFLSFGGLCVTMQTFSVTSPALDRRLYFPGKMIQCCISLLLASFVQLALIDRWNEHILWIPALIGGIMAAILRKKEKSSSIPRPVGV